MLSGDFYILDITGNEEGRINSSVAFNNKHDIFKGHFPEVPVVPGVCQVQAITDIVSSALNEPYQLGSAREIKFLSLINPNETNKLNVEISYEQIDDNRIKATAQINAADIYYLKMKAEFIKKKKAPKNKIDLSKICILVPTYNNCNTLNDVIADIKKYSNNIIVINDGCTDNTVGVLESIEGITVLTHHKNKGKGIALKTGFKEALRLGYEYAITIDSDGQHKAKDIPLFFQKIEEKPGSIIVGTRELNQKNMPGKSNFANKFSNFWYSFQTGISLKDTQSGYRLYPLEIFEKTRFLSSKYEFELEVIVRASWKGIPIETVPIDVYYPPKEERITHFRPFRDFSRISVMNTIFTFLALFYYKPRNLIRSLKRKKFKEIIREDVMSGSTPIHIIASSIGFGVFMGIVPIWGYQTAAGLLLAHLLKLKKTIVFLASNISIPPLLPFILYLSHVTGSYVMGNGSWIVDIEMNLSGLKANLVQYLIGSVVFSVLAGATVGMLSYLILLFTKKIRNINA